ncbi:hypothetical protein ABN117_13915 [Providencia manganoxydans]|uniref:hypothetical protein n=1 Tax=Providencia manganoxydans TaxID=2923283 RepID=UPI0032DAD8D2
MSNKYYLDESTVNLLKEYITDFGMTVDDVVLELIKENKTLKKITGSDFSSSDDGIQFQQYKIYKLSGGKILVTENGQKISNMKKVLIDAGLSKGMPKGDLDPDMTTYQIGRNLFKFIEK